MRRYWEVGQDRLNEHLGRGLARRHFFPHQLHYLPKCGPDGLQLASRMCGIGNVNHLWEVALFAIPPLVEKFPAQLFLDTDLNWHQQHLGKVGLVANANIAIRGDTLYGTNFFSDVVQRISRQRKYKTQIEARFKGWSLWIVNSILHLANEQKLRRVLTPTAELVLAHTDPARTPKAALFRRIYDHTIARWFNASKNRSWWIMELDENQHRMIRPEARDAPDNEGKTICLCHDIERGMGHKYVDPVLAATADRDSQRVLTEMLEIEAKAGVPATYNIVGSLLPRVREEIEAGPHSLGFHSYDHTIDRLWPASRYYRALLQKVRLHLGAEISERPLDQLSACRKIDYRIAGYRPPQSRITQELKEKNLCRYNFEWLASSVHSLRLKRPTLRNRVVCIPIFDDDYSLYKQRMPFDIWEKRILDAVGREEFLAISLHDCYGPFWLDYYPRFIKKLQQRGKLITMDEAANRVFLKHSV